MGRVFRAICIIASQKTQHFNSSKFVSLRNLHNNRRCSSLVLSLKTGGSEGMSECVTDVHLLISSSSMLTFSYFIILKEFSFLSSAAAGHLPSLGLDGAGVRPFLSTHYSQV
jgi:hypothetical protein